MSFLRIFLWLSLPSVIIFAKDTVISRNRRTSLISIDTQCDGEYVEKCQMIESIMTLNLTKLTRNFFIDIRIEAIDRPKNSFFYKMENLDGCRYLGNRHMNRLFTRFYNEMIVNNSHFSCPVKPGIYYLRNRVTANVVPELHPYGSYQLITRIRIPKLEAIALQIIWKYRIERI